jgi:hypothetical protein
MEQPQKPLRVPDAIRCAWADGTPAERIELMYEAKLSLWRNLAAHMIREEVVFDDTNGPGTI